MSLEQHEIELKELLIRVMREPLLPLQVQLDKTGKNVAHLDQQLSELRDVEMGGMGARLDAVEKVLKRLRSWAEEEAVLVLGAPPSPSLPGAPSPPPPPSAFFFCS